MIVDVEPTIPLIRLSKNFQSSIITPKKLEYQRYVIFLLSYPVAFARMLYDTWNEALLLLMMLIIPFEAGPVLCIYFLICRLPQYSV